MNYCLEQAGIDGAGGKAYSYLNWGHKVTTPQYGAIVVFNESHVGFYVGMNGDNYIILHGNWSNMIEKSTYIKKSQLKEFRMPIGY